MAAGWEMSHLEDKLSLRRRMRKLRLVADQKDGADAALAVSRHGMAGMRRLSIGVGTIVAGYWPIATELDIRPLLARLALAGAVCSLPVIGAAGGLVFRRWDAGEAVEEGERGTFQPSATAPEVVPDVLFVPLLAVDDTGFRLGQGGGYYDRTLVDLRACRKVTAVGVGYQVQRVRSLPHGGGDQAMDWVLTDAGLERVSE